MALILPSELTQTPATDIEDDDIFLIQKPSENFVRPLLGSGLLGKVFSRAFLGEEEGYVKIKAQQVQPNPALGGDAEETLEGNVEILIQFKAVNARMNAQEDVWLFPIPFPNKGISIVASPGYWIFSGSSAVGASIKDRFSFWVTNSQPSDDPEETQYVSVIAVGY